MAGDLREVGPWILGFPAVIGKKSPVLTERPEACSLSKDTGHLSPKLCALRIVGASVYDPWDL